jgi:hypothetical protein
MRGTGKLAYVSSKTWEKYDEQYAISRKVDHLKRLAVERAVAWNSASSSSLQLADIWKASPQFSSLPPPV